MNARTISKEQLVPMDAPADGWYHIESNEEHPAMYEEGEIIQVLDNTAMEAIATAGLPEEGLPIDSDHRGIPGVAEVPDTAAAGWVRELAVFDDGEGNLQLAGRIEWTPPGLALVQGKVYKHFSSVYQLADPQLAEPLGGNRYRPLVLLGLALTNNPNNRIGQRPITNGGMNNLPPAVEVGKKTTINENKTMNELEEIKKALGIDPEATAADCVAAIESIKGEASAAAESEAETLLNSEGLSDLPEEEKKELKEGLVTNRALALMTIRAYRDRKAAQEAGAPRYAKVGGSARKAVGGKPEGSLIINRAKEIQRAEQAAGRTCSFWKAHGMAKAEQNK